MAITVNLCSKSNGEIKKFLESYYEKQVNMDEDVGRWMYVYNKPLDAVDIICTVMDNKDKYNITMYIELDSGDVHPVTYENHNDIVKGLFSLFYSEEQV
ncbi:hypothetical protein CDQ84_02600 [Clostridium thermosuccinogenes]|uniref:Uncharacterized protein n=1 Tax=Clostridium thermosuccinogenes TaxID=84032 RepID=A0A2K2FKP8_9CLOT|nr:hypothetical protein [Pseudoclostridium thermosuccinogenes]AUS95963.1 hypothetical protein CDO33_05625 [Pseudoclostridium thermosuccinogenes]PNT93315.1 hypothetical protein CDQ83_07310 [Pseudoclostridium thermosuccinogenes]PNT99352.1 hypothetical protein CDQ85_02600 [Pseudoclostridium thermosuccinogenes]PNU01039.1 hypothetical protein CDQ84_02600 [Pseudoclostridium thermosuccinogenes]